MRLSGMAGISHKTSPCCSGQIWAAPKQVPAVLGPACQPPVRLLRWADLQARQLACRTRLPLYLRGSVESPSWMAAFPAVAAAVWQCHNTHLQQQLLV